jgi:small GTP-binding protein
MSNLPRTDWPNPGGAIPVKVVVVGDSYVGKSAMVSAYHGIEPPNDSTSTPFDISTKTTGLQGHLCVVSLWDCAAGEEMDRLRPLAYHQADIFMLCFSVSQPESYESARAKWAREVRFHSQSSGESNGVGPAELVLVGLMTDLRQDTGVIAHLAQKKLTPIHMDQGKVFWINGIKPSH